MLSRLGRLRSHIVLRLHSIIPREQNRKHVGDLNHWKLECYIHMYTS